MRWFINYIRSLFCLHDWEFIARVECYGADERIPAYYKIVYRCKKCGYVQKSKY